MNQENDQDEMRPEYDIRGGVRGKYYERYIAANIHVLHAGLGQSGFVHVESSTSTASLGRHRDESTVRLVTGPV